MKHPKLTRKKQLNKLLAKRKYYELKSKWLLFTLSRKRSMTAKQRVCAKASATVLTVLSISLDIRLFIQSPIPKYQKGGITSPKVAIIGSVCGKELIIPRYDCNPHVSPLLSPRKRIAIASPLSMLGKTFLVAQQTELTKAILEQLNKESNN